MHQRLLTLHKKITSKVKEERGIALLMTLGILSFLMVLGLSFAFSALSALRGVELAQELVRARLHNESGITKVLKLISQEFSDLDNNSNLFPATKPNYQRHGPSTWDNRYYWVSNFLDRDSPPKRDTADLDSALYAVIASVDFTKNGGFTNTLNVSDTYSWMHIYDESEEYITVPDTPISARLAYLIIDESGKVDPTALCGTDTEGTERRIGVSPSEINLNNILADLTLTRKFMSKSVNPGSGLLKSGRKWDSYYNIFRTFSKDNPSYLTDSSIVRNIVENIFPFSYDIEAYAVATDSDVKSKHRFNLSRTDWDTMSDTALSATIMRDGTDFYTESANQTGIPWLYNSSDSNVALQIAANIIDYCDSNSLPTTDYSGSGYPKYVGLEKVPYINELQFKVRYNPNTGPLNVHMEMELVNMYNTDYRFNSTDSAEVIIKVSSFELASAVTLTFTYNPSGGDRDVDAQEYKDWDFPAPSPNSIAVPMGIPAMTNLTITVVSARLRNSTNKLLDFAFDGETTSPTINLTTNTQQYISIQVDDPRNNLDTDAWDWDIWDDGPADTGSMDEKNTNFIFLTAGLNKDTEPTSSEPWNISTAYIRNAPMQSLWEIGAIHRGRSGQTINLTKYNTEVTISNSATAGLDANIATGYDKGDAMILDQLKMGSDTEVAGRININTYNTKVLQGLLYGINVGGTGGYSVPISTGVTLGTSVGQINPSAIITEILSTNGTTGGQPFRYRGEIARVAKLSDSSVVANQTNDRAKEEIIAKFVNLLTTRQNYFTTLITSQIIRDIRTGYQGGKRGVYDIPKVNNEGVLIHIDRVIAQERLISVLYRDAHTNTFQVVRYEYLDE